MKVKNIIIIAIALTVFLVGISAISADDNTDIFNKDFTIGQCNLITPNTDVDNVKSDNKYTSFTKEGYFEIKKHR